MTMPKDDAEALSRGDYSPDWNGWIDHFNREERNVLYVDIKQHTENQTITARRPSGIDYRRIHRRNVVIVALFFVVIYSIRWMLTE